ncbi:hypothetical protein C8R46DRAFT_1140271 [Mycena filopes]|nr:hypothetical protein C8R46DRAFT_1140271 [Mycena filopes]
MSFAISTNDRSQINSIHNPPPNFRDASEGSTKFTKPPTRIQPPSNPSRHIPSGANPFSVTRMTDGIGRGRGNQTARATVTGAYNSNRSNNGQPPHKKARHDTQTPRARKKVSTPSTSGNSRPGKQGLGRPDDTDVIIVDDDYEDIGERVGDDPLNIRSNRSQSVPISQRSVPDGPSTARLRQTLPPLAPESDPIEAFSDSVADKTKEKFHGRVHQAVQQLELKNTSNETHPIRDLAKMQSQSVKSRMKPKNATSGPNAPVVTTERPKKSQGASKSGPFLPVKAWYLGRKLFDGPYVVQWTPGGKLIIRAGDDPAALSKHTEEVDLGWFAKNVELVEPRENYQNKIFAIETFEADKKQKDSRKAFGSQYSSYFKLGSTSRGEGDIVVKFDSGSPSWTEEFYELFITWLKSKVEQCEVLRGKAINTRWDGASRMSLLQDTRLKREGNVPSEVSKAPRAKTPAIPGFPLVNDFSPPASISMAIGNTAKMRPKHQGGPNTPIEVGSPTRPAPRPLNRPAESATAGGGLEAVRRSARQSVAPQRPYTDPDEVILVYPPGQTGAVNITNGDLARLAPGEFLNDTLIEFGLKLWLQELEKTDPELVKQIHVFSSFFYKKLNKKNPREGYESVQKWTSKFDLFDKKYIVVPINENLHWYLAIIYQPEHTLKPPPPAKTPSTRRKTRLVSEQSPEVASPSRPDTSRPPNSKASSVTRRSPTPVDETGGGSGTLSPSSDMQAEAEVMNGLSISEDGGSPMADQPACETDGEDSLFGPEEPMDVVDAAMDVDAAESSETPRELPAAAGSEETLDDGGSHTASEGAADLEIIEVDNHPEAPEVMDVDAHVDPDESMDPLDLFADEEPRPAPTVTETVKAIQFYGSSAKARGKRRMISSTFDTFPPQQTQEETFPDAYEEEVEDVAVEGHPSTYVFTLDSLGSRHPKVINVLGQYLQFEALEKKGIPIEESSKPIGKAALVPHQPNFCDCGIYLLHLAQTFISDPLRYFNLITATKKGVPNSLDRQLEWNDDQTKVRRQEMADRILDLSREWKKNRAAQIKKTEEEVVESSDDEVDIVDTTPAPPPKTPKAVKAMRLRG